MVDLCDAFTRLDRETLGSGTLVETGCVLQALDDIKIGDIAEPSLSIISSPTVFFVLNDQLAAFH